MNSTLNIQANLLFSNYLKVSFVCSTSAELYWEKENKLRKKTTGLISGMLPLWFCDEEPTSNKRVPQHKQGCESMRETCKNKLPSVMKTCLTQWHLEQILYSNKSDALV